MVWRNSYFVNNHMACLKIIIIIIYFLADALIQGDLQLLQDITLFLHTVTHLYSWGFTGAI